VRAHALRTSDVSEAQLGWALAHEVRSRAGSRLLRKGAVLDRDTLRRFAEAESGMVHLIELGPDDLHEDEAGGRVAHAVAGDGIRIRGPLQSRYNLVAERKGLLRVDAGLVRRINTHDGVTVFTLLDRQPVLPGKIVAGVKATPIAVPLASVAGVERVVGEAGRAPLVVLPYVPRRVAVLATEGLN
jgi:hypothetical protein